MLKIDTFQFLANAARYVGLVRWFCKKLIPIGLSWNVCRMVNIYELQAIIFQRLLTPNIHSLRLTNDSIRLQLSQQKM